MVQQKHPSSVRKKQYIYLKPFLKVIWVIIKLGQRLNPTSIMIDVAFLRHTFFLTHYTADMGISCLKSMSRLKMEIRIIGKDISHTLILERHEYDFLSCFCVIKLYQVIDLGKSYD